MLQEMITDWLLINKYFGLILSIGINIFISIMGFIPSFFVTAANLTVYGFWLGTLISFLGEVIGAIVTFILYRKGFKSFSRFQIDKYPFLKKLFSAEEKEAFLMVLLLRVLPFVPSGIVNLFAAISSMKLITFMVASTIGKIPALLLESYSVFQIISWTSEGKVILALICIIALFYVVKKVAK